MSPSRFSVVSSRRAQVDLKQVSTTTKAIEHPKACLAFCCWRGLYLRTLPGCEDDKTVKFFTTRTLQAKSVTIVASLLPMATRFVSRPPIHLVGHHNDFHEAGFPSLTSLHRLILDRISLRARLSGYTLPFGFTPFFCFLCHAPCFGYRGCCINTCGSQPTRTHLRNGDRALRTALPGFMLYLQRLHRNDPGWSGRYFSQVLSSAYRPLKTHALHA